MSRKIDEGLNVTPIVVEQSFNASIDVVWRAITEKEQMRQWFFNAMTDFKLEIGFESQFNVHSEGKDYLHVWKVTEVVPLRRIAYQWRYDSYPGDSVVKWELEEEGQGTKLKFTHTGHETIQGDAIFSRENGITGWTYFVQESLKAFLAQNESNIHQANNLVLGEGVKECLFVYGSLGPGCPNEHVLGDIGGTWMPATLKGTLREEGWGAELGYPGIELNAGGEPVEGFLFTSKNLKEHWVSLDTFEGDAYRRVMVKVKLENGSRIDAYVYALC